MEQFSHDLTLALEETSRYSHYSGARVGRFGMRRRTRSTGNLPCAPQPTEDSSSSPPHNDHRCNAGDAILSDSDDRHDLQLTLKTRQSMPISGNFESDSFNENFSPARPSTRRKRKFKRMAVEYETTTPSTPGNVTASPLFPPATGTIKKRVLKHTSQENFRANLFFCGKRKRSHRDRYADDKHHSSSVPRQRDIFTQKASYMEYRNRNKSLSKPCERILPLNKSIVSKIEKISQDSRSKIGFPFGPSGDCSNAFKTLAQKPIEEQTVNILKVNHPINEFNQLIAHKSGSFESTFNFQNYGTYLPKLEDRLRDIKNRKNQQQKHQEQFQLQFDDPTSTFMDCVTNEFPSSSSLSSSDSEEIETNESDREGDDELTDWPGNEAMVNFTSKNDFKRAKPPKVKQTNLSQIKSDEIGQDDDTLMSADDFVQPTNDNVSNFSSFVSGGIPSSDSINLDHKNNSIVSNDLSSKKVKPTLPISISTTITTGICKDSIESEMSGETSNHFLSSPNNSFDIREIRAGCRRIRDERPGFSIISNANEDLSRFLQDAGQVQLRLPTDISNHQKLTHLAQLYSLKMEADDGITVLTKTSNTTQLVNVDQSNLSRRFLSDYKRRCYEDEETVQNQMTS